MNSYIPHRLMIINEHIQEDPVLMQCIKMAFQWANEMGLQGKKVMQLTLQKPPTDDYDPLRQHISLWCKIECSEEERKSWDEASELQVKQYVNDMLKGDE